MLTSDISVGGEREQTIELVEYGLGQTVLTF